MKLRLIIITFSLLYLIVNDASSKEKKGQLHYYKDFKFDSVRIQTVDGSIITGEYAFDYYSVPGAHDGDGGTILQFRILEPGQLKEGMKYIINGSIFQVYISKWGSPHYYEKMKNVTGDIFIREYRKYYYLLADINLAYSIKKDTVKRLKERIKFVNNYHWRKLQRKVNWNEYLEESKYRQDEISIQNIIGRWHSYNIVYKSGKEIHTKLDPDMKVSYSLHIKRNSYKGNSTIYISYTLVNGNIKARNKDTHITGVINYIDDYRLIITWINKWEHSGNNFESITRLFYNRIPDYK